MRLDFEKHIDYSRLERNKFQEEKKR